MSSSATSSPKRKSQALEDHDNTASSTMYRSRDSPSHRTQTGSPVRNRGRTSPTRRASSPLTTTSSLNKDMASGVNRSQPSPWSEYTLLQEMTSVAELNELAVRRLERLEEVVSTSERSCALLADRRETMERELLDWKNLLVQKVEGCYTQVLGQLLEAFEGVEGDAVLNREYVSNMLWSTRQLSQASKDALNTPDLDTLGVLRNRLSNKLAQIEELKEEELDLKEDAADWSYSRPEIGDDVIWRLMGTFELGQNGLDSTAATPVTTPCQENSTYASVNPELLGALQNYSVRPTGLPIVSVNVTVADTMDENLNMNACQVSVTDDDSPSQVKLTGLFQTRTLTDITRCHPISLAVSANGDLIIPDKHNRKIKVFTQKGELVREITHDDLRSPTYVAVTPEGDIAVCDRKAGDIKVFSIEGNYLTVVPKLFKSPAGIAFTSTGDLLVGDTGRKAVHVVSLQAAAIKSTVRHFRTPIPGTGCKEDELSQLQWPHCLSVTNDDVIIVSDRTGDIIQMLDVSGRAIGRFGSAGFGKGRLQSPYATAVGENGDILVCDYGNHTLQVLTPSGQWGEPLITSSQGLQFPAGVAWLSPCKLAVSEYLSGIVKIYEIQGQSQNQQAKRPMPRPMSPVY